jgi:hypothetical protein
MLDSSPRISMRCAPDDSKYAALRSFVTTVALFCSLWHHDVLGTW